MMAVDMKNVNVKMHRRKDLATKEMDVWIR